MEGLVRATRSRRCLRRTHTHAANQPITTAVHLPHPSPPIPPLAATTLRNRIYIRAELPSSVLFLFCLFLFFFFVFLPYPFFFLPLALFFLFSSSRPSAIPFFSPPSSIPLPSPSSPPHVLNFHDGQFCRCRRGATFCNFFPFTFHGLSLSCTCCSISLCDDWR